MWCVVDVPFGGASDLWGAALTRSAVNASDFGVRVRADLVDPAVVAKVDHVRVTVYYTAGGGAGNRCLLGVG